VILWAASSKVIALQICTQLPATAVQQDALISGIDVKQFTHFVRAEPFDISEQDHLPLTFRKPIERLSDLFPQFGDRCTLLRDEAG
jgi:hypothetical protein